MDLASLKKALAPLTKFGQDPLKFEVEGTRVELRPLLPREEIAAQQYAAAVLSETQQEEGLEDTDALTRTAALRYFDQFRTEVIAYALVQVDSFNLRVSEIETGEETESGARVRIPKHVAVRRIIEETWSRGMITITWSKYGDLMARIAAKADKITEGSVVELEAEIERTRKRLEELEEERDRRAKGDPGVTSAQITALVDAGKAMEREVHEAVLAVQTEQRATAELQKIAREAASQGVTESPPQPDAVVAAPPRRPVIPKSSLPPSGLPVGFKSSFEDPETPSEGVDELEQELRFEQERQRQLREAQRASLSRATPIGDIEGVEAHQAPSTTLSSRAPAPSTRAPVRLDPAPNTGNSNPLYKKPR